jgi:hypothetical protein
MRIMKLSLSYQWYYFIRICCTPDIILPSRKRRVINLKTIKRGKNQLVFFQALVLPSLNDNCFLAFYVLLILCNEAFLFILNGLML